jgi:hypothetical protein
VPRVRTGASERRDETPAGSLHVLLVIAVLLAGAVMLLERFVSQAGVR